MVERRTVGLGVTLGLVPHQGLVPSFKATLLTLLHLVQKMKLNNLPPDVTVTGVLSCTTIRNVVHTGVDARFLGTTL
jgi:hypothetical protein